MCRFTVPFSFLCYKCKTKYSTLYSTSCLQFYFNCPVHKAHNFSYLCLDTLLFCCCFFFCAFFTLVSLLRFFCKAYQNRTLWTVLKTKPNRNLAMVPGMVLMLMSLTSLWDWAPVGTIGITRGNIQGNSMEPWLLGRENSRFNTKFEGLIRE